MNIYDAIGQVVTNANTKWGGNTINYLVGSQAEVQQRLSEWSRDVDNKENKYPCIIVFTPFPQARMQSDIKYLTEAVVNILIVNDTEKTYTTPERITNVFEPILWSVYALFLNEMILSNYFDLDSTFKIPHDYVDHFHYSPTPAKEQNVFSAVLDAVEMQNVELKLMDSDTPLDCLPLETVAVTHNGEQVTHNEENVTYTIIKH